MPNINTRFTLSGEKEYKQAISEIGSGMKVLDSEMRKVQSAYAQNADSVEALSAKNDVLERKISTQTEKIEYLRAALQQSAEKYGEADKRTMQWQTSLNNAEAELNNLNNQFDENKQKIADSGKEMGNLGDVVNGLTSKLGIQLPDGMKSSMNAMGNLDAQSLALAGGFTAVAAAIVKAEKALISMTREAASKADDLLTLASVTGMTTDSVQELNYMADLTDVSLDRIKDSLKETTNKMQEAATGTGAAYEAYQKLGVEITNTTDGSMRSAQDVFYDTIDALGDMKNQTERDALAMDLMSESAQELNPIIELGGDKLREYAQEAHDMGYVLDNDALKSLQAVDDAYSRLQNTQEGVKNQLAAEFAPYLEEFYGDATQGVKDLGKAIKDSGIVDAFGMLLETVGDILNPMSDLSGNRVPALTNALRPLAEVMALIADTADFFAGLFTLDFKKMGNALGFGYASGNGNKYQTLQDSYAAKSWGSSASDLSKAYEDAAARGDSSTIGITEDEWVRRYLGGNAAGTDNWSGGWTKVNENGLERIYLPSGSRIQTASETRYTGGGDIYIDKVIIPASDIRELNDIVTIFTNERITQRMGAK
jgi:methyl-accepting chemotaxis protein|nr:MAG TPA: tail tape measure [Caudoviricetes sp.]